MGAPRRFAATVATAVLLLVAVAHAQAPAERPQLAEDVFKNVQILRGIPVKEFMGTMGMFAASLGLNCTDCHVEEAGGSWARYADETELKRTTRRMVAMVNSLNKSMFGGRQAVTCFSCHRGINRPRVIPDLTIQYGDPIILEADEITEQAVGEPTPDEVFDRYITAIGGAAAIGSLRSYSAKGTYQGFDDLEKHPLEIYATAPGRRTTIVHGAFGDTTWTFDGLSGWVAQPPESAPVPVMPLTGGDLAGARVEAEVAFPGRIKQMLTGWLVGLPAILADGREVTVVQGRAAAGVPPVKLYFEPETALLTRLVYFNDTPVGRIPTQIDYADYRDVAGVKMPFKWTTTWTDGRSVTELASVQPNVPVEARRFAKPEPSR
jgi:hypothetical protein